MFEYHPAIIRKRWFEAFPETMPDEMERVFDSADEELEDDVDLMCINFFNDHEILINR